MAAEQKQGTWRRRCMVAGCRERGQWQVSEAAPLPTEHPDSHYSQMHAEPRDIASRHAYGRRVPA